MWIFFFLCWGGGGGGGVMFATSVFNFRTEIWSTRQLHGHTRNNFHNHYEFSVPNFLFQIIVNRGPFLNQGHTSRYEYSFPFMIKTGHCHPSIPSLHWRHNERDGVSYHQRLYCLFNCLFRCRSMKTSKLRVTGVCEGNPPVTGGFPSQKASNAENVSIWWRYHGGPEL